MSKAATQLAVLLGIGLVASPAAAVTWGEPDFGDPAVGAMVVENPNWGEGKIMICSGTLIHPRVVLTAGHCTSDLEAAGVTLVEFTLGQVALEGELLEVAYVATHPDFGYGPYSNPHDVGALILAEPVEGVEPAALPELGFLDELEDLGLLKQGQQRAEYKVVGYGASEGQPPPALNFEGARQSAVSDHQALLDAWLRTDQNQAHDNGGSCLGDSGGPVFYHHDGIDVLVAITAWGDTNCVSMSYSYRTDIAETIDFIDSVISAL